MTYGIRIAENESDDMLKEEFAKIEFELEAKAVTRLNNLHKSYYFIHLLILLTG